MFAITMPLLYYAIDIFSLMPLLSFFLSLLILATLAGRFSSPPLIAYYDYMLAPLALRCQRHFSL